MSDEDGGVLVVEDDPEVNELVGAYAELAGFRYRSALSGSAAMDEARLLAPRLIVLDVMLPDFDGFEVCRRLKLDPETSSIPILLLTALDRPEYHQRGQSCGAVAYITKPFDPDRLMEEMKRAGGR